MSKKGDFCLSKRIEHFLRINKKEGIIKKIYQNLFYNDEPKVYSFTAILRDTNSLTDGASVDRFAGGCSFSKEKALIKTIGEAFERYSLSIYREKNLLWDSYNNLMKKAINPREFVSFSEFRIKPKFKIYNNKNEKLNWVRGFSLIKKKHIFVPAQSVFVPYRFKKDEPIISFPITTGAAYHTSFEIAVLTGLLEVIERDAFMISYLNKLSRNIIDITKSKNEIFKKIINQIKRYNLELYILDISTDVPVYSILAVIIDKTGLGPAVSCGLKSDLDINNAIIKATEECLHVRIWIRDVMFKINREKINEIQRKKYLFFDVKERGIIWSNPELINKIIFFLQGKKVPIEKIPIKKTINLDTLLDWFKKRNIEVVYVDVTPLNFRRENFHIVKLIIPDFQPLYLDERFPYWEGKRLKEVPKELGFKFPKEVYKFPHPFL